MFWMSQCPKRLDARKDEDARTVMKISLFKILLGFSKR